MKIQIRSRQLAELSTGLAYLFIGMLGWSVAFFIPNLDQVIPACLFHSLTGLPCPACGATHCGLLLSRLRLGAALGANPFFFVLYLALAAWGLHSLLGVLWGKNFHFLLTEQESKWLRYAIPLFLVLNWLFMILRSLYIKPEPWCSARFLLQIIFPG
jgi:hypothetical protein